MATKPSTPERDQMLATVNGKLDDLIDRQRDFRAERQEQFGELDHFRLTRDTAERLVAELEARGRLSWVLAAAIDRLSQMTDFSAGVDLEAILDLPEVSEPDKKPE